MSGCCGCTQNAWGGYRLFFQGRAGRRLRAKMSAPEAVVRPSCILLAVVDRKS